MRRDARIIAPFQFTPEAKRNGREIYFGRNLFVDYLDVCMYVCVCAM